MLRLFHETENNSHNGLCTFRRVYDNKSSDKISDNAKIVYVFSEKYTQTNSLSPPRSRLFESGLVDYFLIDFIENFCLYMYLQLSTNYISQIG